MELCEIWVRKTTKYSNKKEENTKKRHWICPIEQNKPEREKDYVIKFLGAILKIANMHSST